MIYLIAILGYLLLLTCIGLYKSRQVKTQDDFAVAGRRLAPWVMVCTMLAAWIGTGSIVGNAEQAYQTGAAALIIPFGTFFGMIVLAIIAPRARAFEASSVPQIIGIRYGQAARFAAVLALVIAYMVIVSYQFNAGGAVLEVIGGYKPIADVQVSDWLTSEQLTKGQLFFEAKQLSGPVELTIEDENGKRSRYIIEPAHARPTDRPSSIGANLAYLEPGKPLRLYWHLTPGGKRYRMASIPDGSTIQLRSPRISRHTATIVAAAFITAYTMSAGLTGLASTDIVTGTIILVCVVISFPILLVKAGGIDGMRQAYAAMPGRASHMQFWGVYSPIQLINYLLPPFLLIMGDANQYQRIFASRSCKGARQAVTMMIFAALAVEMLIIACAWVAGSMTPDPENGKYILIYSARHHLPFLLGVLFMVTVVAIIVSTADAFLLVPAVTLIQDIYCNKIHPNASQKAVVFASRLIVLVLAVIAYGVSLLFSQSTGFFRKALYAYTIYGAAITPSLVAAMFWPRATATGALASILTGTAVTLVWSSPGLIRPLLPASIAELDAVLPAITSSVLALILVSLSTGKDRQTLQR
ncbi:MAG: sodium:solute symporter family protein [Sedimentisphaerales bacterium]|nr:sodium:solute symporter family protein [Sedimentisphaerales bacterium]